MYQQCIACGDVFEKARPASLALCPHCRGPVKDVLIVDAVEQLAEADRAADDKSGPWVEHVIKEGSREHVVWWDNSGPHCREPNCQMNRPE